MTELEKMRHAQSYISKLANGIDPISGEELPNDSCLNNVRLSRCFFYVAEILEQVAKNGGSIGSRRRGDEFILTDELRAQLSAANNLPIKEFIKPINDAAVAAGMRPLPAPIFSEWLVDKGFLTVQRGEDDKRRKSVTSQGEQIGIVGEVRSGQYGEYTAIFYNSNAQQFLIDNLDEIVDCWKNKKVR